LVFPYQGDALPTEPYQHIQAQNVLGFLNV